MLDELRKVIPAFLTRVDQPDRGGRWSEYLADTRDGTRGRRAHCSTASTPEPRDEVTLTDFDPDGEIKVVAAALYAVVRSARRSAAGHRARDDRPTSAPRCSAPTSASAPTAATSPGRAFERTATASTSSPTTARSAICSGTGCSRSSGSRSSTRHGYTEPDAIDEAGALDDWRAVMDASARAVRGDCRARARRRRALRRRDGLPRPLLHGHERARGDARHRAAHRAAGASRLPPRLPADAPR